MFWIGLFIGIGIGTIFGATIIKYVTKVKETGKQVAEDLKKEAEEKLKAKP